MNYTSTPTVGVRREYPALPASPPAAAVAAAAAAAARRHARPRRGYPYHVRRAARTGNARATRTSPPPTPAASATGALARPRRRRRGRPLPALRRGRPRPPPLHIPKRRGGARRRGPAEGAEGTRSRSPPGRRTRSSSSRPTGAAEGRNEIERRHAHTRVHLNIYKADTLMCGEAADAQPQRAQLLVNSRSWNDVGDRALQRCRRVEPLLPLSNRICCPLLPNTLVRRHDHTAHTTLARVAG